MDKFINDSRCVEKISVLRSVANILLQSETNNEQKNNCYEIITKMDNYRKHNTLQFLPWFSNAK